MNVKLYIQSYRYTLLLKTPLRYGSKIGLDFRDILALNFLALHAGKFLYAFIFADSYLLITGL